MHEHSQNDQKAKKENGVTSAHQAIGISFHEPHWVSPLSGQAHFTQKIKNDCFACREKTKR